MSSVSLAWFWIAFYALFTLSMGLFAQLWLLDYIVYIIIVGVFLFVRSIHTLPWQVVMYFGLVGVAHTIGTIPFVWEGEVVSLYHDIFFWGMYDKITHVIGFFFLSCAVCLLYKQTYGKPDAVHVLLLFFALWGCGILVEVAEFLGYVFFGLGWGTFAFGAGDSIPYFGAWGDSILDMVANGIGVVLGLLYIFRVKDT